jgi:hypothetical protein
MGQRGGAHVTAGGWIMMTAGVLGMTGLLVWCVVKVLATPGATEHLHSQVDIDTGDADD